ncbi:hypothetical protein K501DRAFT_328960 [Backusella circina FSU 941]|nr:hypothetical protein K501DRAFT_328960 [Backusella circina FSU 941]
MDYFTKFKRRMAPPKQQPTSSQQLAKFHKCWEYVHNIFRLEDKKLNLHVQQTEIPAKLRQMVDLLVDEEARQEDNTTGVCMEYFLKNDILHYVVNEAEKADYPVGFRGEAIRTIASMVDLLDERFLVHNAVHKPTIKLLRFCVLDDLQSELYSDDLVDLMYIICSKIHGFPDLLNIFFHDKQWLTTPQKTSSTTTSARPHPTEQHDKPEYEFLLFTYLLRFVHREGRSGDYARTGLLFLMEMATGQLGEFILGSDFATIMSAGLGALYSQLPRKLVVRDEEDMNATPASFLLGQDLDCSAAALSFPVGLGAEYSNSPEFKYQLDSFLKLLEFCQDVLTRCPNNEICVSLLTSVRTIFLENILYPSVLECSDTDGSSVAVISYIDLILQTVQQEELAKVVVGFLMATEEEDMFMMDEPEQLQQLDEDLAGDLESMNINTKRKASIVSISATSHFTLKDLIFSRLTSKSQTTVIATLKLLKTLLTKHCHFALGLLSITPDTNKQPTVISHHLAEIELYFSLILAIDPSHAEDVLACGYGEYLKDVEKSLESDWCYQHLKPENINTMTATKDIPAKVKRRRSFKYGQRFDDEDIQPKPRKIKPVAKRTDMQRHKIRSTDKLLEILLDLLNHFFTQSSELNLALTGVFSALALCPFRSLEGWLSFTEHSRTVPDDVLILDSKKGDATRNAPSSRKSGIRRHDIYAQYDFNTPIDEDDSDDDRSIDFGIERDSVKMTAPISFKSYPPLFTLLSTLTQQIDCYRSEIQGFDKLLEERRCALITGETSFLDKRVLSPSNSLSTTKKSPLVFQQQSSPPPPPPVNSMLRRPSVLRPTDAPPALSPSTSASTMMSSRISSTPPPLPPVNMNILLNNAMSPLAIHFRKTTHLRVQPLIPSNFITEPDEPILDLDDDDEHTFAPGHPSGHKRMDKNTEITISMVLNNVVILEETIKELVALMQVRRSLGIDEIRFV